MPNSHKMARSRLGVYGLVLGLVFGLAFAVYSTMRGASATETTGPVATLADDPVEDVADDLNDGTGGAADEPDDGTGAAAASLPNEGIGSCTMNLERSDGAKFALDAFTVDFNTTDAVRDQGPTLPAVTVHTAEGFELVCDFEKDPSVPDYDIDVSYECRYVATDQLIAGTILRFPADLWHRLMIRNIAAPSLTGSLVIDSEGVCTTTISRP